MCLRLGEMFDGRSSATTSMFVLFFHKFVELLISDMFTFRRKMTNKLFQSRFSLGNSTRRHKLLIT